MKKQKIEIPTEADLLMKEHEMKGETGVFVAINGENTHIILVH